MNVSEDQLRHDLHDAISSSAPGLPTIDPTSLVAAGHAALRRRRLAQVGAVAAAAAVVVLATNVLGGSNQAVTVPGGHGTSGQVVPTTSATIRLGGPTVAGGITATEFVVKIGPDAMKAPKGAPGPTGNLAYYAIVDGTEQLMGGSSTDGLHGKGSFGYGAGTDVIIGTVPADAVAVSLAPGSGVEGYSISSLARIPGTDFQAVAFRLQAIPSDTPEIEPIWWLADGTPVANSGAGSVVRFDTPDGPQDLWALPSASLSGRRGPLGASMFALSSLFADEVADIEADDGLVEDTTTTPNLTHGDLVHFYVVKGNVTDVGGTYASTLTKTSALESQYSAALDATVILARGTLPPTHLTTRPGPLLTSLTWTDAGGVRQQATFP